VASLVAAHRFKSFGDPLSLTISDPAHSQAEDRFIIIGNSHRGTAILILACGTAA
jgi:uncharacterized DUF497 family protein